MDAIDIERPELLTICSLCEFFQLYNERNGGPRGKDTAAAEHFAVSTRTIRRQIDQWRRRKLLGRQAYLMLRD